MMSDLDMTHGASTMLCLSAVKTFEYSLMFAELGTAALHGKTTLLNGQQR